MVDGSLDRATLARLMAAMTALRAFRSQHVSSVSNESRVVVRDLVAFGPMSAKFVPERCERVREMIAVREISSQIVLHMMYSSHIKSRKLINTSREHTSIDGLHTGVSRHSVHAQNISQHRGAQPIHAATSPAHARALLCAHDRRSARGEVQRSIERARERPDGGA